MTAGAMRREAALLARGAVSALVAAAVLNVPAQAGVTILALYFAADALCASAFLLAPRTGRVTRALIVADAAADILVGALVVQHAQAGTVLLVVVALWALATGLLEFGTALAIPRIPACAWAVALLGASSCALGIALLDWTNLAILGFFYVLAAYAAGAGLVLAAGAVAATRAARDARAHDEDERAVHAFFSAARDDAPMPTDATRGS